MAVGGGNGFLFRCHDLVRSHVELVAVARPSSVVALRANRNDNNNNKEDQLMCDANSGGSQKLGFATGKERLLLPVTFFSSL